MTCEKSPAMKYITQRNPFAKSGKNVYIVLRETKTQYICKNNIRFRKPTGGETDGCSVRAVKAQRWDEPATLHIKDYAMECADWDITGIKVQHNWR